MGALRGGVKSVARGPWSVVRGPWYVARDLRSTQRMLGVIRDL